MTVPEIGRTYLLQNEATEFALAATQGDEPESTVFADPYTPWDLRQSWRLAATPDDAYTLEHPHTGCVLESDGRRVHLGKPARQPAQQWLLEDDGEGRRTLRNVASGLALECNADRQVYVAAPSDGASQRWRFVWI